MTAPSHYCFAATVTGASHAASGRPGEDWYAVEQSADGRWITAIVCDGCGSVAKARDGAEFISEFLSRQLAAMAGDLDRHGPGEWVVDRVVQAVVDLRDAMRASFGPTLADHAATIVAAMVSEKGGFFMHVGDGIASSFAVEDTRAGKMLRAGTQSDPENGEYANETYYVTGADWLRHVRVTPVGATDCLLLCSDGAQSLLYRRNEPQSESIITTLKAICAAPPDRMNAALEALLDTEEARRLSNDDKTALFLVTPRLLTHLPQLVAPPVPPPSPPAAALPLPDPPPRPTATAPGPRLTAALPPGAAAFPGAVRDPRSRVRTGLLLAGLVLGPVCVFGLGYVVWREASAALTRIDSMLKGSPGSAPAKPSVDRPFPAPPGDDPGDGPTLPRTAPAQKTDAGHLPVRGAPHEFTFVER